MLSLVESVLFFLPVFLIINVVAAVPGRPDVRTAVKAGLRHFAIGTLTLIVSCAVLHLLMSWLISRPPLW